MTNSHARISTLVLSSALTLVSAACGGGSTPTCPSGWTADASSPGQCRATSTFTDGVHARIGTGAYGFAVTITGNCQPGDSSTCNSRLEPGLTVRAFPSSAIPATIACNATLPAEPAASATVSAGGTFEMALDPGSYAFVATDPVSNCNTVEQGTVTAGSDTAIVFQFDHGAY